METISNLIGLFLVGGAFLAIWRVLQPKRNRNRIDRKMYDD